MWGVRALGLVVLVFLLCNCAKQNRSGGSPGETDDVARFFSEEGPLAPESFGLLDEYGNTSASLGSQSLPFGILLQQQGKLESYCSLSHRRKNELTTSAHCLHSQNPKDYYAIHFDRAGEKRITPITQIAFSGSPEQVDVAVLFISDEEDAEWEMVPQLVDGGTDSTLANVTLWSFDPIDGERAMQFAPKTCQGSRTQPQYWGVDEHGTTELLSRPDRNRKNLLFYDVCDRHPISGNSGSLLTVSNADGSRAAIGIHQKQISPTDWDLWAYPYFEVLNTRGEKLKPSAEQAAEGLYWAGIFLPDVKIDVSPL